MLKLNENLSTYYTVRDATPIQDGFENPSEDSLLFFMSPTLLAPLLGGLALCPNTAFD
jgi:hypothetical protein